MANNPETRRGRFAERNDNDKQQIEDFLASSKGAWAAIIVTVLIVVGTLASSWWHL